MGMITKETYTNVKNILIGQDSYHISLPCIIGNTGVTAVDGKKILKAGTPLTGDITARDTAFTKATTTNRGDSAASSNAVAILLHDVDVTDGDANGTIVLAGCIDLLKLDSATQELIDAATKAALSRIIFVKGSAI